MTDPISALIQRYSSRGVLVDTNILLLLFVGSFDRELIPRFKRTSQFASTDYDVLRRLLSRFKTVVTCPNVLSEVNSLSGQLGEPARTGYFEEFARKIDTLDEEYVANSTAAQVAAFPRLGLTDSAIVCLAKGKYLVLTDDFKLFGFLEQNRVDAINFTHVRFLTWT